MSPKAIDLINAFDILPDSDKREVAGEILRRAGSLESPPLTDDDLVLIAEESFLELDRREAEDEEP